MYIQVPLIDTCTSDSLLLRDPAPPIGRASFLTSTLHLVRPRGSRLASEEPNAGLRQSSPFLFLSFRPLFVQPPPPVVRYVRYVQEV